MKLFVSSAIAVVSICTVVSATPGVSPFSAVTDSSLATGSFRGAPLMIYEGFESFTGGQLSPQGGWGSQFAANASVTDINPITGQFGGQRSVRHTSDGTSVPGFEIISPAFAGTHEPVGATIRFSGTGSSYQLVSRDLDFNYFNTRVSFDTDGHIRVGQTTLGEFGEVGFEFIDTGVNWLIDVDYRVTIETHLDGTFTVDLDNNEIYEGIETSFILLGQPGRIGQFSVFAGNEGFGSVDGTGDTLTFDDFFVGIIPAPGSTLLLAIGGCAAIRRRR